LRHTHAAWLIADGEHPKAIQTRLGHGSIAVTMDRYGHLMDGLDNQIALHLDARARSAAPPAQPRPSRHRDMNAQKTAAAQGTHAPTGLEPALLP
jgi:hypothetical protein